MSDEKRTYVQLKLYDLTIIEQFICYSEYGMDAAPTHRVLVNAKGEYDSQSDKLVLDGQELNLEHIQITAVSKKEDSFKNFAHRDYISIHMIDNVFSSFVDLLRRDKENCEVMMMLDAAQQQERADAMRLMFDGITVTRPHCHNKKRQGDRRDTVTGTRLY